MVVRVLVTGGSGMLGRSIIRLLTSCGTEYHVTGTGLTRAVPPLRRLDLLDAGATAALFDECMPDVVIHCAAERDPDRAAADPERTIKLNVEACGRLAHECARTGAPHDLPTGSSHSEPT